MRSVPRLYAIADRRFGDPVEIGRRLFEGGARLVQIRDKTAASGAILDEAEALLRDAPEDAIVIVNDRADITRIAGAGGVHLGQSDLPVPAARAIVGPDALVGLSTHNLPQARSSEALPVDYIAAGPVFPTTTKHDPDPTIGLEGLGAICASTRRPVVAIGGVTLDQVDALLDAGAWAVAAVADLLTMGPIERRTGEYLRRLGS